MRIARLNRWNNIKLIFRLLLLVTPGITAYEYAQRRSKLAQALPPNSVAVLAAADLKYRSGAVFYRFHQDPNFLYLTGKNSLEQIHTKC